MKVNWVILLAALSTTIVAGTGCQRAITPEPNGAATSHPTPAEVIAANSRQLMALPDVIGVYEGLMPDGNTHCITVMLSKTNPATLKQLPSSLEGIPVRVETTGEIQPMSK